ncbi:hypothetical protein D3C87_1871500 [compost metagenome]
MVADTGQVLDTAAADQHHRVLLQVVADAGDVAGDLDLVRQLDAGDLAQRRVGLLGRGRVDTGANAATLRASLERRGLRLVEDLLSLVTNKLTDRGQRIYLQK